MSDAAASEAAAAGFFLQLLREDNIIQTMGRNLQSCFNDEGAEQQLIRAASSALVPSAVLKEPSRFSAV